MKPSSRALFISFAKFAGIGLLSSVATAWLLAATLAVDGSAVPAPVTRATGCRTREPQSGEGTGWVTVDVFARSGATFIETYTQPAEGEGQKPGAEMMVRAPKDVLPGWALHPAIPWSAGAWPGADDAEVAIVDARGWPFPTLLATYTHEVDSVFRVYAKSHGGWDLGWRVSKGQWTTPYPVTLPLVPVWPGFAANTLFHACAWWVLLVPWRLVRAARRRKRGACISCGYDVRGLSTCPGCGAA